MARRLFDRIWPPLLILAAAAYLYDFNAHTDGDMFVLWGVEHLVGTNAELQNLTTVTIFVTVAVVSLLIGVTRVLAEELGEDE